jgi:hypothetical protein
MDFSHSGSVKGDAIEINRYYLYPYLYSNFRYNFFQERDPDVFCKLLEGS